MNTSETNGACNCSAHLSRRTLIKAAGLSGIAWLTPVAELLAREEEQLPKGGTAKSVIVLWMQGGPSQLETFDPHPGKMIAGGTGAIKTRASGIQLATGMEQLADQMDSISIVRSVTSREGDHERATYNMKTGYRPDPTVVHPSIGAVICHEIPDTKVEIPRHVSILPGQWPARGGYFGDQYDAFKVFDPQSRVQDTKLRVTDERHTARMKDLDVLERGFRKGRMKDLDKNKTLHRSTINAAMMMISSDQLDAFEVSEVPEKERLAYGDNPFGRGCLAARRLVEVGVRCVEVTLSGWDTHINNHENHKPLVARLDTGFAALIRDLKERKLLDNTIVLCGGEFGRTPKINGADGRDHWPHGFSIALAGGGIRGGHAVGETDPDGSKKIKGAVAVDDIHTTVLHALGVNHKRVINTPIGRPMKISEGSIVKGLLQA
jgi:hypothetical protein